MARVSKNSGKGKKIICAIDLHQESMLVGTSIDKGEISFREFKVSEAGFKSLASGLGALRRRRRGSEVFVAYEASGSGFRLADFLRASGFRAFVLAPTHLPVTVKSRSNKTDKRDVIRIHEVLRGHVLAGNSVPEVWTPPRQVRDDRELIRRRLSLKEQSSRVKNRIHGLLRRHGIKKPAGMKGNWTKKHLGWLGSLDEVLDAGASGTLMSYLRELDYFESECRAVEREMVKLAGAKRYRSRVSRLLAIPGVGLLTAMVFLTELGELERFPNRKALGSYLGLAPRCWESGEQSDRKGAISKLGPSRVRKVLNQAAWSLVRWSPYWNRWFKERTPKGKGRRKMIVAVMRNLGITMWHLALTA